MKTPDERLALEKRTECHVDDAVSIGGLVGATTGYCVNLLDQFHGDAASRNLLGHIPLIGDFLARASHFLGNDVYPFGMPAAYFFAGCVIGSCIGTYLEERAEQHHDTNNRRIAPRRP
jgi:hypothetical protein